MQQETSYLLAETTRISLFLTEFYAVIITRCNCCRPPPQPVVLQIQH